MVSSEIPRTALVAVEKKQPKEKAVEVKEAKQPKEKKSKNPDFFAPRPSGGGGTSSETLPTVEKKRVAGDKGDKEIVKKKRSTESFEVELTGEDKLRFTVPAGAKKLECEFSWSF